MATMKHTPGPWKVEYENYGNGSFREWFNVGPARVYITDSRTAMEGLGQTAEAEANARLIAAAPELLEALEKIAEHIPGSVGHPSALDCCVQMRDDAIAAIKAATENGK